MHLEWFVGYGETLSVSCKWQPRAYLFKNQHFLFRDFSAFSALTLLVGWQEGHLACKNWAVGCWHGYLSAVRCRFAYGPANATATHSLAPVNPDLFYLLHFTFLVPAHLDSPRQNPQSCKTVVVLVTLHSLSSSNTSTCNKTRRRSESAYICQVHDNVIMCTSTRLHMHLPSNVRAQ